MILFTPKLLHENKIITYLDLFLFRYITIYTTLLKCIPLGFNGMKVYTVYVYFNSHQGSNENSLISINRIRSRCWDACYMVLPTFTW